MIDVDKLIFIGPDADSGHDWASLHRGSWAIPEGTTAEWRIIVEAIERGDAQGRGDGRRLAMRRGEDGSVILWSPRNSSGANDHVHVAKEDVPKLVRKIREGLVPL